MCIICIDLQKGLLTPFEARRNLVEMSGTLEVEHIKEVQDKIYDALNEEIYEYSLENEENCYTCGS